MIKQLRKQRNLSQEQLAEATNLSIRTIQRVEAGHRVAYSSLRALASALDVNVDELEWELYAMDKLSDDFVEAPLWVRQLLRKTWHSIGRKWSLTIEKVLVLVFLVCFVVFLSPLFDGQKLASSPYLTIDFQILIFGFAHLMAAYWIGFIVRLSDQYGAWSQWDTSGSDT